MGKLIMPRRCMGVHWGEREREDFRKYQKPNPKYETIDKPPVHFTVISYCSGIKNKHIKIKSVKLHTNKKNQEKMNFN